MRPRWERYWMTCAHTLATSTETGTHTLLSLRWQSHDHHVTPLFQPRLFLCVCFALDGLDKLTQPAESDQIVSVHILCLTMTHQQTLQSDRGGNTYCWACSVRENSLFCQLHTRDSFISPTRYTLLVAYSQLSTASCRMREGASVPDMPMDCVYVCYSRAHSWEDGWSPPEAGCCCFAVFSVSSSSSLTSSLLLFPFCCILLCRSVTMAAMDLVGLWRRTQDKIIKLIINTQITHKMIMNMRHTYIHK